MGGELVVYDYWKLTVEHEFFKRFDFWERLSFVSEVIAPKHMREKLYETDIVFVKAVMRSNIQDAYKALCDRYEVTGHTFEGGIWFSGDEIGPATLGQCLEFAEFWHIDDPRLPRMREDHRVLEFAHAFENPYPGEVSAIGALGQELNKPGDEQLLLFDDES